MTGYKSIYKDDDGVDVRLRRWSVWNGWWRIAGGWRSRARAAHYARRLRRHGICAQVRSEA